MKVLVLSSMYPNSVLYMSGIFVHEQVKQLKKLDINLKVAAPVPYSPSILKFVNSKWKAFSSIPKTEIIDDIEIVHNRYIAIPRGIFKNYWAYIYAKTLEKLIDINEFDFIHAHGGLPDDYAAYLLSKKYKKPYIITVHGETVYFTPKNPRHFSASKKALENADYVVGVSDKVVKKIEQLTERKINTLKILNGFNPPKNVFKDAKEANELKILFGGTLVERKGIRYLISAFSDLLKVYPNIILEIAGGGELLAEMKSIAKTLEIRDKVRFYGVVEHSKMLQLMADCDIFILPSWNEAFGVVYLEAMSFCKPVIGTLGEGIEDIVTHNVNGLLIEPKSEKSIFDKLSLLIQDKDLREKLGAAGNKSALKYTWENNALEYFQIYKELFNKK